MNEYFAQMVRYGGAKSWTDAIFPLSRYLKDDPAHWAFALDWGIADQLRLLHRGKLHIAVGTDQVSKPEMTAEDRAVRSTRWSRRPATSLSLTRPISSFSPGTSAKLTQFAAASGYRREVLAAIPDSYGRNVYEVYRFVK